MVALHDLVTELPGDVTGLARAESGILGAGSGGVRAESGRAGSGGVRAESGGVRAESGRAGSGWGCSRGGWGKGIERDYFGVCNECFEGHAPGTECTEVRPPAKTGQGRMKIAEGGLAAECEPKVMQIVQQLAGGDVLVFSHLETCLQQGIVPGAEPPGNDAGRVVADAEVLFVGYSVFPDVPGCHP